MLALYQSLLNITRYPWFRLNSCVARLVWFRRDKVFGDRVSGISDCTRIDDSLFVMRIATCDDFASYTKPRLMIRIKSPDCLYDELLMAHKGAHRMSLCEHLRMLSAVLEGRSPVREGRIWHTGRRLHAKFCKIFLRDRLLEGEMLHAVVARY